MIFQDSAPTLKKQQNLTKISTLKKQESTPDFKLKRINPAKNLLESKLVIRNVDKIHILDLDSILFLKADGNYTTVHCINSKVYCTSRSLKYYQDKV